MNILLIEDDLVDRLAVSRALKAGEVRALITEASDGRGGIAALRQGPFDCILLDYHLPDMDGEEFLSHHLAAADHPTPIVVLTGSGDESLGLKMVKLGAEDFLTKSDLSAPLLMRSIRYAIERKKLGDENKRLYAQVEKAPMLEQIAAQNALLEQKNITLREMLHQVEQEKQRLGETIRANLEELVLPIVTKLRQNATGINSGYLGILEDNLKNFTSGFGVKILRDFRNLTPREVEICNMIRSGVANKDIARLLSVSYETIKTQRKKLRKKLGLSGTDTNLETFLMSLATTEQPPSGV